MKGTIHSWDNEKKYGLIQVENSQRCVVAHITAFSQKHPQPKIGEEVTFDLFANQEKNGKAVARTVQYVHREKVGNASYQAHKQRQAMKRKIQFALIALVGMAMLSFAAYKGSQVAVDYYTSEQPTNSIK